MRQYLWDNFSGPPGFFFFQERRSYIWRGTSRLSLHPSEDSHLPTTNNHQHLFIVGQCSADDVPDRIPRLWNWMEFLCLLNVSKHTHRNSAIRTRYSLRVLSYSRSVSFSTVSLRHSIQNTNAFSPRRFLLFVQFNSIVARDTSCLCIRSAWARRYSSVRSRRSPVSRYYSIWFVLFFFFCFLVRMGERQKGCRRVRIRVWDYKTRALEANGIGSRTPECFWCFWCWSWSRDV